MVDIHPDVRLAKAVTAGPGTMDYAELFRVHRQMGEGEINFSHLNLGMAACELAIAITPREPEEGYAPSMYSRLPDGEMDPENIFDLLSDAERLNLERASSIVDLIRASFTFQMNQREWRRQDG